MDTAIRIIAAAGSSAVLPFTRADIDQTVPARFGQVVRCFPDKVALTGNGRRWTYRELDARANQIAGAIARSARAGSGCVVCLADHSPEMVIAMLAILKAGQAYLAIHPAMPARRQAEIVRDMAPDLILAAGNFGARAAEVAAANCPVLLLDEIDGGSGGDPPALVDDPARPSTIFYTSGSTGRPKAVVKSHRAVMHRVWLAVQHDGIGPADRQSLLTHCSFAASEADMFGALLNGATLCLFDFASEGMGPFREWVEAEQITALHPPVLLFRRFLATLTGGNLFPAIRLVTLAGDVVMPADVEAWKRHFAPTCVLMHRFSATETGMLCVARIETGMVSEPFVIPAARPVADKHIEIVDESGQPVLPGEPGELLVRSAFIADGYWRHGGQGDGAFGQDPEVPGHRVYRTGDLARMLPDGGLVFLGRRDRQVKIRGFRVELAEIEAALLLHTAVREVAVVVRDLAPADKQLVAYVVPGRDPRPSGAELRGFLEQRLPHYMMPARFEFLEAMPLTPTGKIDRQRLPAVDVSGPADPPAAGRDGLPRDDLERQLVAIWKEVLAVDPVGTQDNFFDLGGHSLLAAQMFTRVEERLHIRLPLATLFRTPTIEGLAKAIGENRASQPWRSLVPVRTEGGRLPVFAVPGIGGNVLCYRELSRLLGPDQPFYGLQSRGLGGTEPPLTDIETIAAAHLEEVRLVQPTGPYVLVGACLGGVVAYEMAQQLRSAGQKVALLALIEASVPRVPKAVPVRPEVRLPAGLRFVFSRLQLYWQTLAKLKGRQRLEYLGERLKVLGQIVAHRDLFRGDRTEFHSQAVAQANIAAFRKYRPRPYPGRLVLFCAEGRQLPADLDRRLSWAGLAAGGVERQVSPGDDSGQMLISPHVEVLAPKLAACLARVQHPRPPRGSAPGAPQRATSGRVPGQVSSLQPAHAASRVGTGPGPDGTVADAFVELLNDCGVDYVFINPGSDIAPIQESIARFAAEKRRAPALILCLHESVALAAAHGYFMVTGRPQVVLVHADVGTLNLGANLHNAQRGRAGVVVCAGTPPLSVGGGPAGSRSRHMDWIQEQFNQASAVAGYVKWHYRLTAPENLRPGVQRAFQLASAAPAGPVYLALPRDVLMAPAYRQQAANPARVPATAPQAFDPAALAQAAQWLLQAERPLILVACAGRNPAAVPALVRLAETLGAPVVESRNRVNFPASHPLHLGYCAFPYARHADCILILDHDVPWVPAQGQPAPGCRIIQVDMDPLKRDMPLWEFPVDLAIQADSALAIAALADEIGRRLGPADRVRIGTRRGEVAAEHQVQRTGWRQRAIDLATRRPIAPDWAAHCLNEIVDERTVIVSEAVSNNPVLWRHVDVDLPGNYYQSLGSGLGWSLGAALGAKLADPSRLVICTVGDGSWVFGSPIVAYWAAAQANSPFLTVVFNNGAYAATIDAIRSVAPDGYASRSGTFPACDLPKPPLFSRLAAAMGLWARTVHEPAELGAVLREARDEVLRGRSALVDICISAGHSREFHGR